MDTSRSFNNYPETMTSEQVGELLGHPATVILMWVREGRFPAYKEPGSQRWWFDRDEVIGSIGSYGRIYQYRFMRDEPLGCFADGGEVGTSR